MSFILLKFRFDIKNSLFNEILDKTLIFSWSLKNMDTIYSFALYLDSILLKSKFSILSKLFFIKL